MINNCFRCGKEFTPNKRNYYNFILYFYKIENEYVKRKFKDTPDIDKCFCIECGNFLIDKIKKELNIF